jgi:hypothetical protein
LTVQQQQVVAKDADRGNLPLLGKQSLDDWWQVMTLNRKQASHNKSLRLVSTNPGANMMVKLAALHVPCYTVAGGQTYGTCTWLRATEACKSTMPAGYGSSTAVTL